MALDSTAILNALRSHAATLGVFEHVIGHALINPPPTGIACAVEFVRLRRARSSGLASTSALAVFKASIYRPLQTEPADDIEVEVLGASDAYINALSGDIDLGGNVRCVDLLGQESDGLGADGGYAKPGDITYRASIVNIPLIVNDVWPQVV
jgi:hypothetical protein